MKQQSKLRSEEKQEATHHSQESQGQQFASPEELLRFDAAKTRVPSSIAERLQQTISKEPSAPKASWLRRLFPNL